MKNNHLVRPMNEHDIKEVQFVAKKSWHSTYEGIIPVSVQERFLASAYDEKMLKKRLQVSSLYVVEVEGRIVGFANFSVVKEDGKVELGAIYLLPDFQGYKIGTALLNKGIESLKDASKVFVNVEKENKSGLRFYFAKGFKVVAEFEDNLEGHQTIMVRMVLEI